jgi:hypothetical protein
MAELKTKATEASIDEYIASRANEEQRGDCKSLMAMLKRVTKESPKMWGPSIVGYDLYESQLKGSALFVLADTVERNMCLHASISA